MSARTFTVLMGVLALVGLLAFGLQAKGGSAIELGDPAPDKELDVLGGEGTGRVADYRGKWVVVNFWASWCGPCRDEAPALEAFWRKHRDEGLVVLGVNLDDTTGDAQSFVEEFALTYPQLRDGDGRDRRQAYGMTGFPESFLVDPEGRLALIRRGPVTERYLSDAVAPFLDRRARGTSDAD